MLKFMWILLLLHTTLFSLEVNKETNFNDLLLDSKIYKDHTKSESIKSIQNKKFKSEESWGFGYSPNYDVWIKFTLTNKTSQPMQKILEYANPLTSYVEFYEGEMLRKKDGLLRVEKDRRTLNPILKIRLEPHESKVFFVKASSRVTTLIVKLNLWNAKAFEEKERNYQLILALFFGAMGIIVLYNFIIFLATKEWSYLYYVLFFASISLHHLIYKGIATLYISSDTMAILIGNASFIVAMPMFFLALFTHRLLRLKQYSRLNKTLNFFLIFYFVAIVLIMMTNQYQYRSFFLIFPLVVLFYIAIYALLKKNKQAYFIIGGLSFLTSSGLFMYLSSAGIYDVFQYYPYYVEFSLVAEITIFSLALATKIKMLNQEKVKSKERKFLLKELKHRVQNNTQTILTFLILQRDEEIDIKTEKILLNLENRILATSELYALLEMNDKVSTVNMNKYFSSIICNIQKSFNKHHEIKIEVNSNILMNSEYAIHCGLIVNEAVTNAFKHAFNNSERGVINIELHERNNRCYLSIRDNGSGFKEKFSDGLGMSIIDTLATIQLEGTLKRKQENGTQIEIEWKKYDK